MTERFNTLMLREIKAKTSSSFDAIGKFAESIKTSIATAGPIFQTRRYWIGPSMLSVARSRGSRPFVIAYSDADRSRLNR